MALPNILLLTTDQQRWDALSSWGTPGYTTPHLDQLAHEGVSLERCYTTTPICTPARVSLLTGQHPTRHGAYSIGMRPVPALEGPTLPRLLAHAGYATAIVGKTHFVARHLEARHVLGWDLEASDEPGDADWDRFDSPYLGFDFVRHCSGHTNDRPPGGHYRRWLRRRGADLDACHRIPSGAGRHTLAPTSMTAAIEAHNARQPDQGLWDMDPGLTQNAWIAEEVCTWIDAQPDDRPWFCMANFQDPHPPFVCPEPYYSAVDMAGVSLGDPAARHLADRPPFYRHFVEERRWFDADAWHDGDRTRAFSDGLLLPATAGYAHVRDPASAIRAYCGMVTMVDAAIGRILAALGRGSRAEDTLVIMTSDHGEYLGRHGLWWKGLPAFDDAQRVPCLMRWPAVGTPQGRVPAFASLADLMPTALAAAGVTAPAFTQGVSQLPVLTGASRSVRDHVLVDYLVTANRDPTRQYRDLHQQTLVVDGWKLVCYGHADYGELYDLAADPDQHQNGWEDRALRTVRERLLLRLAQATMAASGRMPERVGMA